MVMGSLLILEYSSLTHVFSLWIMGEKSSFAFPPENLLQLWCSPAENNPTNCLFQGYCTASQAKRPGTVLLQVGLYSCLAFFFVVSPLSEHFGRATSGARRLHKAEWMHNEWLHKAWMHGKTCLDASLLQFPQHRIEQEFLAWNWGFSLLCLLGLSTGIIQTYLTSSILHHCRAPCFECLWSSLLQMLQT